MSACLSRRSFLSESDRLNLLFLLPSNNNSLVQQMQLFEFSVQQCIWVENYGQQITLSVNFLNGTQEEKLTVRNVVENEINKKKFMNVYFDFESNNEDANIRITFYKNQFSWSAIGTEAALIPEDVPTMNLADISQGNILHQFAHSLGFPHENEYISNEIPWNRPVVDDVFSKAPHFWKSNKLMKDNFYDIYNLNQFFNYRNYNSKSLMCNVWPCFFFTKNNVVQCDVTLPDNFSQQDIRFFRSFYPFLTNATTNQNNSNINLLKNMMNNNNTNNNINNQITEIHQKWTVGIWLISLILLCVVTSFVLWYLLSYKKRS